LSAATVEMAIRTTAEAPLKSPALLATRDDAAVELVVTTAPAMPRVVRMRRRLPSETESTWTDRKSSLSNSSASPSNSHLGSLTVSPYVGSSL
jgi:hypothetical protein